MFRSCVCVGPIYSPSIPKNNKIAKRTGLVRNTSGMGQGARSNSIGAPAIHSHYSSTIARVRAKTMATPPFAKPSAGPCIQYFQSAAILFVSCATGSLKRLAFKCGRIFAMTPLRTDDYLGSIRVVALLFEAIRIRTR